MEISQMPMMRPRINYGRVGLERVQEDNAHDVVSGSLEIGNSFQNVSNDSSGTDNNMDIDVGQNDDIISE